VVLVATLHERQTERMDRSSRSRTRWLVILGAIAAVILAVVLIVLFAGGGGGGSAPGY
jgi:ABC-type microcin C transport system permease subunit YejB